MGGEGEDEKRAGADEKMEELGGRGEQKEEEKRRNGEEKKKGIEEGERRNGEVYGEFFCLLLVLSSDTPR